MRVFVTGIGVVSPLGASKPFEERLFAGQSGLRLISRFDASPFRCRVAGEALGLGPYNGEGRLFAMFRQAAAEAMEGADFSGLEKERLGVFASASKGGMEVFGNSEPQPGAWLAALLSDSPGQRLRDSLGWRGTGGNYPLACATGAYSIGEAFEAIRSGRLDAALAGAAEASLTPLVMASFQGLGALAPVQSGEALRGAFDQGHDGFVMGEGAALLRLESEAVLSKTGSQPLAEILSWSVTCDAAHITAPDPSGSQAARAMRESLQKAGLGPGSVAYLNAHGTATPLGDAAEAKAICAVFGRDAKVSGIKAATGHLLGASGALEAVTTVLALCRQEAPPQIAVESPMPEMEERLVLGKVQGLEGAFALSLSMGFGGHNVALLFKGMN